MRIFQNFLNFWEAEYFREEGGTLLRKNGFSGARFRFARVASLPFCKEKDLHNLDLISIL